MKLQRYWVNDLQCTYISDEHAHSRAEWCKSADVSALEAENERVLDRVEFLVRHIHEDTPLQWVADELHAILQPSQSKDNREQEKQP